MATPSQPNAPRTDAPIRTPTAPRQAAPGTARPPRKLDCSEAGTPGVAEPRRPARRPPDRHAR